MKTNILSVLPLAILTIFAACRNEAPIIMEKPNTDTSIGLIIKKFNLPYPEDLKLDSNSLIFYGDRTFDTSFLVHLEKKGTEINGTYYEVLPNYHRNINDVRTPDNQILYFEGYGFILDPIKWGVIKNRANDILLRDTSTKSKNGCCDGEKYGLYYNNIKKDKGNQDNNIEYQLFYKFLKDNLLEGFIQKRIPIMHKIK